MKALISLASALALVVAASAQPPGRGPDAGFAADRDTFHYLLENHKAIQRTVKDLKEGVETVTESDDPKVAARIQEHVASMEKRVKEGRPIHRRDPLFAALFDRAGKITMKVEKTPKGMRVTETSEDPYTAKLIQAHARVVSLFVANGFPEVRKNHEVPAKP
jgi:hypothetical protein